MENGSYFVHKELTLVYKVLKERNYLIFAIH